MEKHLAVNGVEKQSVSTKKFKERNHNRKMLKWTIPEFAEFIVNPLDKDGPMESKEVVDSPNLILNDKISATSGEHAGRKFQIDVRSINDGNEVRINISGKIFLKGVVNPRFSSKLRFSYGRYKKVVRSTIVELELHGDEKVPVGIFKLEEIVLDSKRPLPKGYAELTVYVSVSEEKERKKNRSGVTVATDLLAKLQDFYIKQKFTDIVLESEGKEIAAHRALLAVQSGVLADLLKESGEKVTIADVCPEALKIILDFCYGLPVEHQLELYADRVYPAAEKYELKQLREECMNYIGGPVTMKTAVDRFIHASKKGLEEDINKALSFIVANHLEFSETGGHVKMLKMGGEKIALDFFIRLAKALEEKLHVTSGEKEETAVKSSRHSATAFAFK